MPWNRETGPDGLRLVLTGQVDVFEAAALHGVLVELAREGVGVHVDVSRCEDLDGSALQLLVAFERACRARTAPVAFAGARGRPGRLLAWVGLDGPATHGGPAGPGSGGPGR
jgi:ABC-type transporter Mla MlaB component